MGSPTALWLDSEFAAYGTIQVNGVPMPRETIVNFTGTSATGSDNPNTGVTTVTVNGWSRRTISATTVGLATDNIVGVVGVTGPIVYTLPAGYDAQVIIVKAEDSNVGMINTVTIKQASGNIDGASTVVINSGYGSARFYSDANNWHTW